MQAYIDLDLKEIGVRIQRRRGDIGMSMAECARRADINRGTLYTIESGGRCMSLRLANRIAHVLHFSGIDDLMGVPHHDRDSHGTT